MEDHSKLITKDNMYREICGMSWGEYCCKVLDRCEDGDDDSIRIDMEVSEKIESLYAEAEFEKITPEEGGDFIPSGGRTWRKK
jgi:hypothetical protein